MCQRTFISLVIIANADFPVENLGLEIFGFGLRLSTQSIIARFHSNFQRIRFRRLRRRLHLPFARVLFSRRIIQRLYTVSQKTTLL